MYIHSLDKSHKCGICDKSFAQKGHLTERMLIHTGDKLHSCETCGKSFTMKGNLI